MAQITTGAARRAPSLALLAATTGALALALTACGGTGGGPAAGGSGGGELTMWSRVATDAFSQDVVDTWNAGHDAQIKLTIVPDDAYQQKVGSAAGSGSLPDLLSSDVVYAPNYVKQGIYLDITDTVKGLDFYDSLVTAHTEAMTKDGQIYGIPFAVDSSLLIYNKTLYEAAGLDPEAPPTTYEELYEQAKAIRALGGDTYGFYFGGNCSGCLAFTTFPDASAAGSDVFTDEGATADFDSESLNATWALYKKMVDEDIAPSTAKTEDGSTWGAPFVAGKIGIIPIGTFLFNELQDQDAFDWGVTPLMAPDGSGTATFVGGDVVGVTASSKNAKAAQEFLEWSLSEENQVEVIAKNGDLPARTDLADNKYTAADPRVQAAAEGLADGYTPAVLPYGELINAPTGPWLQGVRGAVFDGDPSATAQMQEKIQAGLDSAAS